ncbi:MAG: thermonuclease family protein [Solirubrobacterales bacterium]
MSSRTAGFWVAVFLLLAFAGGGGLELLGSDGSSSNRADLTGRVTRVVDGDTVKVRLGRGRGTRTVRYIGVDTPESVKPGEPVQCFALQASEFNKRLVQGRRVRLRIGRERTDRYGRLLAYVYVRGRGDPFVNAELLRRGYARTLAIPPNTDRAGRFAQLERRAREKKRGLWAACG